MFWKILKLLNYSYVAKIMTGKPKISDWTNMTKLYPVIGQGFVFTNIAMLMCQP